MILRVKHGPLTRCKPPQTERHVRPGGSRCWPRSAPLTAVRVPTGRVWAPPSSEPWNWWPSGCSRRAWRSRGMRSETCTGGWLAPTPTRARCGPARTWTRCPTAARSTARSACSQRWRRSPSCAPRRLGRPCAWSCFVTRRAVDSAADSSAAGRSAGTSNPTSWRLRDAAGVPVGEALAALGLVGPPVDVALPAAFVEVHIEQGPVLERSGLGHAVVSSIAGMAGYAVSIDGASGHAGHDADGRPPRRLHGRCRAEPGDARRGPRDRRCCDHRRRGPDRPPRSQRDSRTRQPVGRCPRAHRQPRWQTLVQALHRAADATAGSTGCSDPAGSALAQRSGGDVGEHQRRRSAAPRPLPVWRWGSWPRARGTTPASWPRPASPPGCCLCEAATAESVTVPKNSRTRPTSSRPSPC